MGNLESTCTAPHVGGVRARVTGEEIHQKILLQIPPLLCRAGGGRLNGDDVQGAEVPESRVRTPGCHSIGYMDHTGCHQLNVF
jgi:hypothetical protein